jgi:putative oxidoreductase
MANPTQLPGVWHDGIAIVRIVVGVMLVVHGWQVFQQHEMQDFGDLLLRMSMPFPEAMPYAGKLIEIGCGLLLILGLLTRLATALLFITFIFITFIMGEGRIFSDNELPFLFALVSLLFFFTGSGRLSIDFVLFANRKEDKKDAAAAVSKQFGRYVTKN